MPWTPNQRDRRSRRMEWSMVSKAAERSSRQANSGSSTLQCVWCWTLASMTEVWRTFGITFCTFALAGCHWSRPFQSLHPGVQVSPWDGTRLHVYYVPPCIQTHWTPEPSLSKSWIRLCNIMQFNEFEYHFACRHKVVHVCFIMSPGKMIFAVLELWLSPLQWVLNW